MTYKSMRVLGIVLVLMGMLAAVSVYAAPTVQSLSPANGVSDADASGVLTLTFAENVGVGTGTIEVFEVGGPSVETADVAESKVTVDNATVAINLDNTLAQGKQYRVTIPAGAIVGNLSGDFPGFSGADWSFTTEGYVPQADKLTPPTSFPEYRFGWAVAQDGDWLVVGSYGEQVDGVDNVGAAWVYKRDGNSWQPHQKLLANDGGLQDEFGWSVDIDGDTIAVGAWEDETDGSDPGRVYVYVLTGDTWTLQQRIVPTESNPLDGFGHEVLLNGDTLFVGAPGDGGNQLTAPGAAYVFTRTGTAWTQSQRFVPSGQFPNGFGFALAVDGDNLLIGAPFEGFGRGAVYAYELSNNTWVPDATNPKLLASDGTAANPLDLSSEFLGDFFGTDISIDGTEAVITAWQDETPTGREGSAYIFNYNGGTWTEGEKLLPDDADHDGFGYRAEIVGDVILVGADVDGIVENPATSAPLPGGTGDESGIVYQFVRDVQDDDNDANTGWLLYDKFEPDDNKADDYYGNNFAFDGTTAYIGAWEDAGSQVGMVYVDEIGIVPTLELVLYNTDTEADVRTLATTDSIELATAPSNWGVKANIAEEGIAEVAFTLSGDASDSGTDTNAPFTFPADGSALNLTPGAYTLNVQVNAFGAGSISTDYALTVRQVFLPADVNEDGFVTPVDAVMALNRLGTSDVDADVDGNGTVQQADVDVIVGLLGTTG
jgi:methionine-rich copper-binding protein CopC